MKKVVLGLLAIGFAFPTYAQTVDTKKLSEVIVYATNYKYLKDVNTREVASIPVELLERKVAAYNPKGSDFYQDEYDLYQISFYLPEGKILAAYDKDGNLIRTAERFKDINLPNPIREAILKRFPGWTVTKDVYSVSYHKKKGAAKKYKLKLENGDETIRVKIDETGEFL
ncbi:nicotinate-nucleotide adenylyltransferase [Ulvibacterium marinum]|uniref:Nicotinate-nucleotide adenylyltransferase n=1 Tax=Ulvibacterium marinum TaxID=2419782 RepID=A0A3B0C796_9FLAO|nr:nicotinate-nucleotide adenylyltransferase [Ulvibacterium marinum]RKN80219.1 nicotinate-nucleotide adenylyltransferase [Ulvibacterium marinum]